MAQEPRLIAFEQALKDEGIVGTQLEPFARSIFQQESSSGKNIQTSNAGARGPMQVLPTTFKAYNPQGNIDNPYDNIVGGIRYIKDLFSKTNDLNLTAVGYYGGPKAIEKAKQGVAVRDPRNPNAPDTLQYASQVTSRNAPAPETKSNSSPVNKTIRQEIANLGVSYQAALALMAKADSTSSRAREKIAEEDDFLGTGNDGSQAKKMLQQVTFTSPFATKKTKKMKSGGDVKAFANGGDVEQAEPSTGEKVKGTAKEILRSTQYTPYDLLGAPVDVLNLGLKGVDYLTGSKLATERPVGGSDYLIEKSRQLGIADKPTGSLTETLTRLGTGIASPTAGPRAMAVAAEKIAAKAAPKTASRAQLDDVIATQPPKTLPAPVPAPVPSKPLVIGKMGPDEIDPAVQKQIDEIVIPTKQQKEKDRLFFGQVEKWTESLSGKPTVQEIKNRFAKIGRDYEVNRLDLALQGKNPNDKVTSKELLEALKTTSPQRYRTVINEPQLNKFYQGMDNPRPSEPLGTINLLEDVDPKASLSSSVSEDLTRLKNIVVEPFYFSMRKPGDMDLLATYFRGPLIGRPDLANPVKEFETKIAKLDDRVTNLQSERDAHKYIYTGSSKVGLDGGTEIRKAQEKLLPKILKENNLDPTKYQYNFELPKAIRETLDEQVKEIVSTKIAKKLASKYKFEFTDIPSFEKTMGSLYERARLEKQAEMGNSRQMFEDVLKTAIDKTRAQGPYEGQHVSITGDNNPVAFSRFLEVELPINSPKDMQKGIFVTELQSDRFDDLRKLGPRGGSVAKDYDNFQKIDSQIDSVVRKARQFLGNRNFKDLSDTEQKKYFQFGIEENKLVQKRSFLKDRLKIDVISNPEEFNTYSVAEAFPGMERMPQVSQQLMIKNAVAAAIQRKNQFVLFPGADSSQAQLYEKLPFNLKTVAKDLGPGFEIKKVPMPSENGDIVERIGIFWDQKAANRVAKEGVRFAKGGSVDKNNLPDQKYI